MRCADLPIPEPCHEPWEAMTGDDRRRHCAACDQAVVALSALTRAEAVEFLAAPCAGHRCVQYAYDEAGVIEFADTKRPPAEPPPERPMMRGRVAPPRPPTPAPEPSPTKPPKR